MHQASSRCLTLNETQVKWIASNLDKMESRLKLLGREIKLISNDSMQ